MSVKKHCLPRNRFVSLEHRTTLKPYTMLWFAFDLVFMANKQKVPKCAGEKYVELHLLYVTSQKTSRKLACAKCKGSDTELELDE